MNPSYLKHKRSNLSSCKGFDKLWVCGKFQSLRAPCNGRVIFVDLVVMPRPTSLESLTIELSTLILTKSAWGGYLVPTEQLDQKTQRGTQDQGLELVLVQFLVTRFTAQQKMENREEVTHIKCAISLYE
ncbi:hypothetical protein Salat_1741700 [Sesamum alatum]|uniref:Uncharacterized protein n=1 Tax=Sesamum alatum TaxID=300844 RepID=A0AAE2CKG6_9LAMI|nr:hypothetical protein Salat_1741700 [Sesamum alatum]